MMENIESLLSGEGCKLGFGTYLSHYDYVRLGRDFSLDITAHRCMIRCESATFSLHKHFEQTDIPMELRE